MNKSVIFHYSVFNTGGAERSTNKMMTALCDRGWDVTLLLTTGGGDFEKNVDSRVAILKLRDKSYGNYFIAANSIRNRIIAFPDLIKYGLSLFQQSIRLIKIRKNAYQAAIVSLQGLSPKIVLENIKCEVVVHMIRNDISTIQNKPKIVKAIMSYHNSVNHYICVAQKTKDSLLAEFPMLASKTSVIHNLLEPNKMLAALKGKPNPYVNYSDKIKVVTVCRLNNAAKGITRMVEVHRELMNKGYDFYWFIVGEGKDRKLVENKIVELGMENHFILLGHQDNPYPFFYYADVSATLSHYEGFCGTVNEAKVMGKPVIATQFSGIDEQIELGKNGVIVENNKGAIVVGMEQIIMDVEFRTHLTNDYLPQSIKDDELKITKVEKILLGENQ